METAASGGGCKRIWRCLLLDAYRMAASKLKAGGAIIGEADFAGVEALC
jgi:hypothetical protein